METVGDNVIYPTIEQIVDANRRLIEYAGGSFFPPDNLRNRDSLEYILDAIQYPIGGQLMFPALHEKAAALGFQIITRHVFFDGNKRTGMHMTWEFLKSNNVDIHLDHSVIDLAVAIATGNVNRDDFIAWLLERQ